MVFHCTEVFNKPEYNKYFNLFEHELSDFQKWAIYAIVNGHHSLITAHTGSGKTLPSEFAIQHFKGLGKKVIYTAPIKALCNQKLYDFRHKYPHISFGILTGDVKDNPDADVLIMTTEILRNTLFTKSSMTTPVDTDTTDTTDGSSTDNYRLHFDMDIQNELGSVVFDEVHYIGDKDRGSVWEQAILLLPPHVQLIMLSATIEKPEIFASWLETEKNRDIDRDIEKGQCRRELYMSTTRERVVPLTHYAWIITNQHIVKDAKDTEYEGKLTALTSKPIVLATSNGTFDEINYHKLRSALKFINKNRNYVCRQHVLNELIRYLHYNSMLPAICFVFSRKNVERFANEINITLFDKDDITPNIIEHECEKILISKFKNYKEYLGLEEYRSIISLLKKGIAIHHAGIMPVLREMVELLFEKRYIKLLFATETFAVGINMPTKTVIFTDVSKFSGHKIRYLLPHEYTQMAGRAGRRGIDTVGHVIHCSNLFDLPYCHDYKNMLTGPPRQLTSQFKISYNLILNIIYSNKGLLHALDNKLLAFVEKSFIQSDIRKEINSYNIENVELEKQMAALNIDLSGEYVCVTPPEIVSRYTTLQKSLAISSQKQKKRIQRELTQLYKDYVYLEDDISKVEKLDKLKETRTINKIYKVKAANYLQNTIDTIINVLRDRHFLNEIYELTDRGIVAMHLHEVHSLALADLYISTDKFSGFNEIQLVQLFSCFASISTPDDKKLQFPNSNDPVVNATLRTLLNNMEKYYDLEYNNELDTGIDCTLQYELLPYISDWCDATDELNCRNVINNMKIDKEIFIGEFVKAILKINNIASEFEKLCEQMQDFPLLQKIKKIPQLTLKYVATNQSLYI